MLYLPAIERSKPVVAHRHHVTHRIVICLVMSAFDEELAAPTPAPVPAFFSKIFQNFKLSSAAKGLG
jgi:hypothetical protein